MSKTVWKFDLDPRRTNVHLPVGARILTAGASGDQPFLWVLCDRHAATGPRFVVVLPAGDPVPELASVYVGAITVIDDMGPLVFHVFTEATRASA